jgi:hypothetical protein
MLLSLLCMPLPARVAFLLTPRRSRILLPTKVPNVHVDVGDGAPYFDPSVEGWIRVAVVRRSGEGDADDRTQSEARERQAKRLMKIAGGGA